MLKKKKKDCYLPLAAKVIKYTPANSLMAIHAIHYAHGLVYMYGKVWVGSGYETGRASLFLAQE